MTSTETPPPRDTPTSAPTATADQPPVCAGDCNGDQVVSIEDLITVVSIALGAPVPSCAAADADGDGVVGIEDLITAVNNALDGCAGDASRKPTTVETGGTDGAAL